MCSDFLFVLAVRLLKNMKKKRICPLNIKLPWEERELTTKVLTLHLIEESELTRVCTLLKSVQN